ITLTSTISNGDPLEFDVDWDNDGTYEATYSYTSSSGQTYTAAITKTFSAISPLSSKIVNFKVIAKDTTTGLTSSVPAQGTITLFDAPTALLTTVPDPLSPPATVGSPVKLSWSSNLDASTGAYCQSSNIPGFPGSPNVSGTKFVTPAA